MIQVKPSRQSNSLKSCDSAVQSQEPSQSNNQTLPRPPVTPFRTGITTTSVGAFVLLLALILLQCTGPAKTQSHFDSTYESTRRPVVPHYVHRFGLMNDVQEIRSRVKRSLSTDLSTELDYGLFDEPSATEYLNVLSALRAQMGELYAVDDSEMDSNFSYAKLSEKPWTEQLRSNFLWAVNLHIPGKAQRTAYFEQLQRDSNFVTPLPRYAHVVVLQPPEIREYLVGPMNAPTELKLLQTLPYHKRPLGTIEYEALVDFLAIQCIKLDAILQAAYGASYFLYEPSKQWHADNLMQLGSIRETTRCQRKFDQLNVHGRPNCLIPTFTSPMVTYGGAGIRRTWLRLMHQVIAFIQQPVDIQFNVDHTSINPNEWKLLQIWFQGHNYNSAEDLLHAWKSAQLRIRSRPFVPLYSGPVFGKSTDMHETIVPASRSAGPEKPGPFGWSWIKELVRRTKRAVSSEPEQKFKDTDSHSDFPKQSPSRRIWIQNRHVKYDLWDFHFTVRRDTGLRVYGIYFNGLSLVAEGGMDETATVYWGWTPFMRHMTSLETMFGAGAMTAELIKGIDCPESAIYLPVRLVLSGDVGPVVVKQGVCLFESTVDPPGGPARRHYEFSVNSATEKGMPTTTENSHTNFGFAAPGRALVLRSITSLFNYDYLFDVVFHTTGVIEFAVTPSGHVHVDAVYPWPSPNHASKTGLEDAPNTFGFLSNTNLLNFVIHHHLFHFKVDVDVINRRNSFEVVHVYGPLSLNDSQVNVQCPGRNDPNMPPGLWMTQTRIRTEQEARFHTKFEVPMQYLTCAMSTQSYSAKLPNQRCLALVNKGAIKTLLSDAHTESFAWTRHQLSVTRQHDDEPSASSIYNGVDLLEPTVNFTKFSENDESIENADLVLWVTMGNYHLPRQEDLPNTVTSGGKLAFYLTPHNLFRYSPDAYQCDQFYTENKEEWMRGSGENATCLAQPIPKL